jgi:hypothetical protein
MFFGGWLYPDAESIGVAGEAALEKDAFDCAAVGRQVKQETSAPAKRKFMALRTDIDSLRFNPPTDR